MKYKLIISITLLFLIACKQRLKTNTSENNLIVSEKIDKEINSDSLSKKVVSDFYKWYINDVYLKHIYDYDRAPYKKYDKNKYGLDIKAYETKLKEVSFFSNSFRMYLIDINKKCNQDMLKEYWDSDPNEEGGSFNIPSCQYRWNYRWFGNQEDENNKFDILDKLTVKNKHGYKYFVQTYMYENPFIIYEVSLIIEDGTYKINFIKSEN